MNQIEQLMALAEQYASAAWHHLSLEESKKRHEALRAAIEQAIKLEHLNYLGAMADLEAEQEENAKLRADAERYRWLRDANDWYAEPRLDESDGTVWRLTFYTTAQIEDPSDDDSLDAAIDAALARAGEKK
jgi:hypothetical protein